MNVSRRVHNSRYPKIYLTPKTRKVRVTFSIRFFLAKKKPVVITPGTPILKMDGKPTNFSWESCFMSYPNQAFSWKIKVTVTFFGRSCLTEKIRTLFSVTRSTSSLFYSKSMYWETCGKLFRAHKTNGGARERRCYFFVIIFLEFPVRTYLRRETNSTGVEDGWRRRADSRANI